MSSTVMLTGNIYDSTRTGQADTVTITPVIPEGIPGVVGVGVLDDGVLLPDPITVAANSSGEFSVLLIPTSQTLASANGLGVRYTLQFEPGSSVEISMPDGAATTLAAILSSEASTATLSPTARQVVYDESLSLIHI